MNIKYSLGVLASTEYWVTYLPSPLSFSATSSTEASGEAMEVEGEGGEASDDAKPEAEKNPEKSAVQEPKIEDLSDKQRAQQSTLEKLGQILSGSKSIFVHLQFLIRYVTPPVCLIRLKMKKCVLYVYWMLAPSNKACPV